MRTDSYFKRLSLALLISGVSACGQALDQKKDLAAGPKSAGINTLCTQIIPTETMTSWLCGSQSISPQTISIPAFAPKPSATTSSTAQVAFGFTVLPNGTLFRVNLNNHEIFASASGSAGTYLLDRGQGSAQFVQGAANNNYHLNQSNQFRVQVNATCTEGVDCRTYTWIHDNLAPQFPASSLVASPTVSHGLSSAQLSWQAATDTGTGVQTYKVIRQSVEIASVPSSQRTYVDEGLTPGQNYTYSVQAIDGVSLRSNSNSVPVLAPSADTIPPATISSIRVSLNGAMADVYWIAPGDDDNSGQVDHYDLRKSTSVITNDAQFNAADVIPVLAPLVSAGIEQHAFSSVLGERNYFFAVKAFDEVGNVSGMTTFGPVAVPDIDPPTTVALSEQTKTSTSVTLSWQAPYEDSIVPSGGAAARYEMAYVQGSIGNPDSFSFSGPGVTLIPSPPIPAAPNQSQSYMVSGLANFTWYTFGIRSYDAANNVSATSLLQRQTMQDVTPPAAVTLAVQSQTSSSVTLAWNAPGDDGTVGRATTYDVRYSTSSTLLPSGFPTATSATGEPSPKVAGQPETFTISSLNPNTRYYFSLKTADERANWSPVSTVVNVQTDPLPPSAANSTIAISGVPAGGLMADGIAAATVVVTVRNSSNQLMSGLNFDLSGDLGLSIVPMGSSGGTYTFHASSVQGGNLKLHATVLGVRIPASVATDPAIQFNSLFGFRSYWQMDDSPEIVTGDFNLDTAIDFAVLNREAGGLSSMKVVLGDPAIPGEFISNETHAVGRGAVSLVSGDLNNDGYSDFATANRDDQSITIYLYTSIPGVDYLRSDLSVGVPVTDVKVGEFTGNSALDLAVAAQGCVMVYSGSGTGTFTLYKQLCLGAGGIAFKLVVTDINHDGRSDIVASDIGLNRVVKMVQTVTDVLQPIQIGTIDSQGKLAAADLNGDGYPDIFATNELTGSVSCLMNSSSGVFHQDPNLSTDPTPKGIQIADVNMDGALDLVISGASSVQLHLNAGDGSFLPGRIPVVSPAVLVAGVPSVLPRATAVADLDQDGSIDLLMAGQGGLAIFINQIVITPPPSGIGPARNIVPILVP